MNRRGFIGGLITSLAAPSIIRTPGLLMPIRPLRYEHVVYEIGYRLDHEGLRRDLDPEHRARLNLALAESLRQTKWNVMMQVFNAT